MEPTTNVDLAALQTMSMTELRARYAEVFGEQTSSGNRVWMVKRLAWRLQALAEGGLSERARRRAAELACDADLRLNPPRPKVHKTPDEPIAVLPATVQKDDRLPPPGSVLFRPYKGRIVQVLVTADGFAYEGRIYTSLSAAAKAITGSHINGFLFFRQALDKSQENRS